MKIVFILLLIHFSIFGSIVEKSKIVAANSYKNVNVPPFTYFTDSTPVINNHGQIAFHFFAVDGSNVVYGVLFKDANSDETIAKAIFNNGEIVNHVEFGDNDIFFSTHNGSSFENLYRMDINSQRNEYHKVKLPKKDYLSVSFSKFNEGSTLLRVNDNANRSIVLKNNDVYETILSDQASDINYVYVPRVSGEFGFFKIRYGRDGDYKSSDKEVLYRMNLRTLEYRALFSNKESYDRLENIYNINSKGQFVAFARQKNKNLVISNVDGESRVILDVSSNPLVSKVDLFTPAINNDGIILLRGSNLDGHSALFMYRNGEWKEILAEGFKIKNKDTVYKMTKSSNGQMFKGGVALNDNNEIVLNTFLKNNETILEGIVYLKIN